MGSGHFSKILVVCFCVLLLNSAYLLSYSSATLFYVANVLLHFLLGGLFLLIGARYLLVSLRHPSIRLRAAALLLLLGALLGIFLIFSGATRPFRLVLWSHIILSAAGTLLLAAQLLGPPFGRAIAPLFPLERWMRPAIASVLAVAFLLSTGSFLFRLKNPSTLDRIKSPLLPPASMDEEGGGPGGPFFPSSALTADGKLIPAEFFMSSETCKRCHADLFEQWNSSAHHFASFNNQWYRKSVECMQEVVGTRPSKWCGGCHDHALLFSGQMDTPIKEIVHTPAAQAGLGCVSCHSIVHVGSSMGNGSFVIEYPRLHELAASENRFVRRLHDFVVNVNPKPHRRTFLKPFMRQQTAEFCSACHKVHLDVPVNAYRWIRGFNEYDNWQASAVSGQGARSFYYPPKPMRCADCHMPLVPSFVANGHIENEINRIQPRVTYAQPAHLFRNLGKGRFEEVTGRAGDDLPRRRVARGAAYADIDKDGDLDVLITTNGGRAVLFRNDGSANHSLRVRLLGTRSNRDGIGAVVKLTAGEETQWQMLRSGSSYLSQSELILTFGLGQRTQADLLEVRWPSGQVDRLEKIAADQPIKIQEGGGQVAAQPLRKR